MSGGDSSPRFGAVAEARDSDKMPVVSAQRPQTRNDPSTRSSL